MHCIRPIDRTFPTISGWTSGILRKRQNDEENSGCFGQGHIEERLDISGIDGVKILRITNNNIESIHNTRSTPNEVESCTNDLMNASNDMAVSMLKVIRIIKHTQPNIRRQDCFTIAMDIVKALMGVSPLNFEKKNDVVAALTQAMAKQAYRNTKWIASVERMYDAIDERVDLTTESDFPNYSLGFTQMFSQHEQVLVLIFNIIQM